MNEVAHQYNINKSTVCRISGNVEIKPGNDRPSKSTVRQGRQMLKIGKVDSRKTVVDVTNYAKDQLPETA